MASGDQKIAKIQTHFHALSTAATSLNIASDELTKVVGVLDEALKKLNVGLTAWVPFLRWSCEPPEYDEEQIGYCKINSKWGIAIRRVAGDYSTDEGSVEGPWLFNDAPREMRLRAVDKIPEMIEALSTEASKTTKRVLEKTKEVRDLASSIEKITNEPRRAERSVKGVSFGTSGITAAQLKGILTGVQERQKFLGELLEHASRWELGSSDLWIYFPAAKQQFGELLQGRESLAKVSSVAMEVLGYPVQVVVKMEPPTIDASKAGNDKGGK